MRSYIKFKLLGGVFSDGSFRFLPSFNFKQPLDVKSVDIMNHPAWTGRRPKEQTEISAFISRFNK